MKKHIRVNSSSDGRILVQLRTKGQQPERLQDQPTLKEIQDCSFFSNFNENSVELGYYITDANKQYQQAKYLTQNFLCGLAGVDTDPSPKNETSYYREKIKDECILQIIESGCFDDQEEFTHSLQSYLDSLIDTTMEKYSVTRMLPTLALYQLASLVTSQFVKSLNE